MTEQTNTAVAVKAQAAAEIDFQTQSGFDEKQMAILQNLGVKGANRADLDLFFSYCKSTGLNPFRREVYMIQRSGKQTIQTGIDGFRVIARRAADKNGETISYDDTQWCGPDGEWTDIWLDAKTRPAAAKVVVYRGGQRFSAVALWSEYGSSQAMWGKMPTHMLAKVAEALVLRKAFPADLAGIYTSDEMDQADGRAPAFQDQRQAPAPQTRQVDPNASTAQQWTAIANGMKALNYATREEMIGYAQAWAQDEGIEHPVTGVRDFTKDEATDLIEHLREEAGKLDTPAVLDGEIVDAEVVES